MSLNQNGCVLDDMDHEIYKLKMKSLGVELQMDSYDAQ
jgi:hypothetical protein